MADTLIEPFELPKHKVTFVGVTVPEICVGCDKTVPLDPSKSITQDVFAASRTLTWYVPAAKPLKVFEVCQVVPLIEYSYVPAPPDALLTTIEPFVFPKHALTFVAAIVAVIADGCVIVNEVFAVALHAFVTITAYVPAARPVMSCVFAVYEDGPVQAYVKVEDVDPAFVILKSMAPFDEPLQFTLVCVPVIANCAGSVKVILEVGLQLLITSVTLMLYAPAGRLLKIQVR